jgi:two-component system, cell cycle sensor histidine kinase and response regulator CckA
MTAPDAGRDAASIAHELNDVLTAMLALIEFTNANLSPDSPAREDITAIGELAARAALLVKELKDGVASSPGQATETILVVEDELPVRQVICRALTADGYTILEAENGEGALDAAARHNAPIHLVITDIVMPEMSGTELSSHLRRWYPSMRILFISGYAHDSVPREHFAEGAGARFLAKPFTVEQLKTEVRRMLNAPSSR